MGRAFECRRRAKESRWAQMSKVFPKLAKSITLAAKNGGPDPETNAPLRVAIANAKAQNLSRENIEAAIKRAAGKDASEITEVSYEEKVRTARSFSSSVRRTIPTARSPTSKPSSTKTAANSSTPVRSTSCSPARR